MSPCLPTHPLSPNTITLKKDLKQLAYQHGITRLFWALRWSSWKQHRVHPKKCDWISPFPSSLVRRTAGGGRCENQRQSCALESSAPTSFSVLWGGRSGASGNGHSLFLSSLQPRLHSKHIPLVDALAFTKLGLLPRRVISYLPFPRKEANIVRVLLWDPHKPLAFVPRGNNSWLFMTITSEEQDQLARLSRPSASWSGCAVRSSHKQKSRPYPAVGTPPGAPRCPQCTLFRIWVTTFRSTLVANANDIVIHRYEINLGSAFAKRRGSNLPASSLPDHLRLDSTWKHSWC